MCNEKSGIRSHTPSVVTCDKGRLVGPKPPLKPEQVWAIRPHFPREKRIRDLAMLDLAIDSKLRGSDLVRLKISQLAVNATLRHRATMVQQKTGRRVQFELAEGTRESPLACLTLCDGVINHYVSPRRARRGEHVSTREYARTVCGWIETAGLARSAYSTPSLRRTKVALIGRRTGNLAGRADPAWLHQAREHGAVLCLDAEETLTLSEGTES